MSLAFKFVGTESPELARTQLDTYEALPTERPLYKGGVNKQILVILGHFAHHPENLLIELAAASRNHIFHIQIL